MSEFPAQILVSFLSPRLRGGYEPVPRTSISGGLLPPYHIQRPEVMSARAVTKNTCQESDECLYFRVPRSLRAVMAERERQDKKWGEQNHEPVVYFAILAEEFGEVAKEVVELEFDRSEDGLERLRAELIQTAAVAVAMVESLDRRTGS